MKIEISYSQATLIKLTPKVYIPLQATASRQTSSSFTQTCFITSSSSSPIYTHTSSAKQKLIGFPFPCRKNKSITPRHRGMITQSSARASLAYNIHLYITTRRQQTDFMTDNKPELSLFSIFASARSYIQCVPLYIPRIFPLELSRALSIENRTTETPLGVCARG